MFLWFSGVQTYIYTFKSRVGGHLLHYNKFTKNQFTMDILFPLKRTSICLIDSFNFFLTNT